MAALGATSSATPSVQTSLMRSRLDAARREADQAQANEQRLRQQVSDAESQTEQSQNKVRSLSRQASQTDPTYATNLQRSSKPLSPAQTQPWMSALSSSQQLKTLGQAAGRYINMSA
ncbi:hypothetical protein [Rhodoferax sp.]|uniref:hypothetical protein n=1 Tax=Rhodoferax sp. TaxID=50421 RepID=UPI0026101039|nr:hypothetical protein [Rhodoferax sp.]MDD2810805.1 hypothetical protein [Rhodoferax sp.]